MKKTTKNIFFAFILNSVFAVIEVIGGFFTNSFAIISDGLHDFGDAFALGFAFFLEKRVSKNLMRNIHTATAAIRSFPRFLRV